MWTQEEFTAYSADFEDLPIESVASEQSIELKNNITAESADFEELPIESAALDQSMWLENSRLNQVTF